MLNILWIQIHLKNKLVYINQNSSAVIRNVLFRIRLTSS